MNGYPPPRPPMKWQSGWSDDGSMMDEPLHPEPVPQGPMQSTPFYRGAPQQGAMQSVPSRPMQQEPLRPTQEAGRPGPQEAAHTEIRSRRSSSIVGVTTDRELRHKLQSTALRIFEQIRDMLNADQEQLFGMFLDFDVNLCGRMSQQEFRRLLQTFDPSINVKSMDAFLRDIDEDGEQSVSFAELLDWWETQRADKQGAANDLWFMTRLKAQFAAQLAKDLWISITGVPVIEKRLSRLTLPELEVTVRNYRDDLYLIRLWMQEARTRSEEELEGRLMKQAESLRWSSEELDDIKELFYRVSRGRDIIRIDTELPHLCALLNYDITYSCMERTAKLYDPEMDLKSFLIFWACRPESGKLNTGKNPVWRWGAKKPTGPDAPQPSLF